MSLSETMNMSGGSCLFLGWSTVNTLSDGSSAVRCLHGGLCSVNTLSDGFSAVRCLHGGLCSVNTLSDGFSAVRGLHGRLQRLTPTLECRYAGNKAGHQRLIDGRRLEQINMAECSRRCSESDLEFGLCPSLVIVI